MSYFSWNLLSKRDNKADLKPYQAFCINAQVKEISIQEIILEF